jgi:hypothetical protein
MVKTTVLTELPEAEVITLAVLEAPPPDSTTAVAPLEVPADFVAA